jgi:hypothetical protein
VPIDGRTRVDDLGQRGGRPGVARDEEDLPIGQRRDVGVVAEEVGHQGRVAQHGVEQVLAARRPRDGAGVECPDVGVADAVDEVGGERRFLAQGEGTHHFTGVEGRLLVEEGVSELWSPVGTVDGGERIAGLDLVPEQMSRDVDAEERGVKELNVLADAPANAKLLGARIRREDLRHVHVRVVATGSNAENALRRFLPNAE